MERVITNNIISEENRSALQNNIPEFPTVKNEEWKFTPVHAYYNAEYPLLTTDNEQYTGKIKNILSTHLTEVQQGLKDDQQGAYRIVLVNEKLDKTLSELPYDDSVIIQNLSEANTEYLRRLNKIVTNKDNFFATDNAIHFEEGLLIHIKKNAVLDRPLHIIHLFVHPQPSRAYSRIFVNAEQGSAADIIETYIGEDGQELFVNAVVEIDMKPQAIIHHYDIQKAYNGFRQVKRTEAAQNKGSNYSNYTFNTPGGDFYRNNLSIHLNDPGLECHLYGLYLCNEKQLVDNHTEVHHKLPNCESNQLYKGLLLDESKAVFNGKIFVYEDAQKTNAFQQSNNILFSDKATIHAKPQLEIFADDVKCSHGTTIGQLDHNALFYLKSRGISEVSAKRMLANAFAFDVAERIKNPALRHYVEEQISNAMA